MLSKQNTMMLPIKLIFLLSCYAHITNAFSKKFVDGSQCNRVCNGTKMNCFYHFHIENIYSMGKACYDCPKVKEDCFRQDCIVGGGGRRTLTVANRRLPGPPIEICNGDTVKVLAENMLSNGESTTLHWHGLHMKEDPYMDGVPFVTQCPIISGTNFTYQFTVSQAGTYFWHSHSKFQRGEGLFGGLIVKEPLKDNPHRKLYDYDLPEHVIFMFDWNDKDRMNAINDFQMGTVNHLITTGFLINGLGYENIDADRDLPLANFKVKQGYRYRFRMISSEFADCPYTMSIDNHNLTVIATDGHDIQPIEVKSITVHGGERYDFIINANQTNDAYWIRVRGLISCAILNVSATAILQYEGATNDTPEEEAPTYETSVSTSGLELNPITIQNITTPVITVNELKALQPTSKLLKDKPTKTFYLSFQMNFVDSPVNNREGYYGNEQVAEKLRRPVAQINHIAFQHSVPPLLPNRFHNSQFCTIDTIDKNCTKKYCACPHVITAKKDELVEMVFIEPLDQTLIPAKHPIHLHGYTFYVVGMGEVGENTTRDMIIKMDEEGKLKRNLENPPLKDTVFVPSGGYVIIRFIADNPGYWLLHCHIEYHADEGMQLVLKVGNALQMAQTPRNFPECNNYVPS